MVALARRIGVILHSMWVEDADFRADRSGSECGLRNQVTN
ncbi:hypothetical protein EV216_101228 [Rhodovulum steppense]|uniref:Transposase IS116/IS110/IS902 family protein n=1 Tax=Rhodovulum steppense TaxID=540251 RepID=A0A4R1Z3J3_9RHOB|nr:hypothetical protein EV216_101228 [Rhodovulum steppense]